PADMIQADPSSFKACIGAARHVIEFLLAIHKEHAKDERSYKLQIREDVLPLVAMIPNYIDQEHFVGVIAAALDVEKTAVRLELTRLLETTHSDDAHETNANGNNMVTTSDTPARKRIDNVRAYLQAVFSLLPNDRKNDVATHFKNITTVDI
ncbi:MAG: hypothetical protein CUN56_16035, partial [Phototrophicales bacterium]